jgi:hypothetical protein
MSEDRRVPPLADKEICGSARATVHAYGASNRRPVNIIRCLQSGWIPTKVGRKKLIYRIVDDSEMGADDGKTEFANDSVVITVKRSVHEKAFWGDGRSRMTLAHELAHGVLHYGAPLFRKSDAAGATELSRINAAESAEHQAKVFAAAFLIDDAVASTLSSPEEISMEFIVSLEAAKICFERLADEAERARSAERVRQINADFQASMRKPTHRFNYTGDFCTDCGNATLIPVGVKLLCHTCGAIHDK